MIILVVSAAAAGILAGDASYSRADLAGITIDGIETGDAGRVSVQFTATVADGLAMAETLARVTSMLVTAQDGIGSLPVQC